VYFGLHCRRKGEIYRTQMMGMSSTIMKIVKIESFAQPLVGLVKITTDSGEHGWGQIATFAAADIVAQVLHRMVAPVVLGNDPYQQDDINELVIARNLKFPGSFICRALAAIDTAIWDLKGKIAQKPGRMVAECRVSGVRDMNTLSQGQIFRSAKPRFCTPKNYCINAIVSSFHLDSKIVYRIMIADILHDLA
jgi:hypothetical protein